MTQRISDAEIRAIMDVAIDGAIERIVAHAREAEAARPWWQRLIRRLWPARRGQRPARHGSR